MTEDADTQVSDTGGTMVRLTGPTRATVPDLACLEARRRDPGEPTRLAGTPPYLTPGDIVTWSWGRTADLLRVVRDDDRGLVAWLPRGSERLGAETRDGLGLRDRSLADRVRLLVDEDYDVAVRNWWGPGILRVAPTGAPWSLWYFTDEDGRFEGHYVNLELPHRRAADGGARTHSRDLTLDLWLDVDGSLWLKDADELDAGWPGVPSPPSRGRPSETSPSRRATSSSYRGPGRSTKAGRLGVRRPSGTSP